VARSVIIKNGIVLAFGDFKKLAHRRTFPLPTGNVRKQKFIDIWRYSPQFQEVRSISMADLQGCSKCVHSGSCSRCPGLAYMEGNMRGPSIQDCEKSFARTGIPSENLSFLSWCFFDEQPSGAAESYLDSPWKLQHGRNRAATTATSS